jgi:hypothetical protein
MVKVENPTTYADGLVQALWSIDILANAWQREWAKSPAVHALLCDRLSRRSFFCNFALTLGG